MRLIEAERITVLPGAPAIYASILDHPERGSFDLSSLRLAVTGAADVPVALVERMRRELNFETVLTGYGLTEAVVATMCRPGTPRRSWPRRRAGRGRVRGADRPLGGDPAARARGSDICRSRISRDRGARSRWMTMN